MRSLLVIAALTCLTVGNVFAAKERTFIDEPEPIVPGGIAEPEPWREQEFSLPPWPRNSDLIELQLDAPSPFRYYVDARSLSIGSDAVVRYTLIAESPSGARNVTFEGLRCTPRGAVQTYAYGAGGELRRLPESDWASIKQTRGDAVHKELHGHFLCGPKTFAPRPEKDMIRALKGRIAEKENAGFLPD
jgi:hypothetical protein